MKSYLSLIPAYAKVHRKQNRMTLLCIILSVFLVTAIFGMADMEIRSQKHYPLRQLAYPDKGSVRGGGRPHSPASGRGCLFLVQCSELSVERSLLHRRKAGRCLRNRAVYAHFDGL